MRIALVADVYPPLRSSGAVQLRDLAREFARQGHSVTVMVAAMDIEQDWELEERAGIRVLRLRTPRTKDMSYVRRALGEALMPFAMLRSLRRSPLAKEKWDGVVWYSPTIFLGYVVHRLKRASRCRGYLVIRDIFPEWAVDMGLLGKGLAYAFFKAVANYQYRVADVIGVQSEGNLGYFDDWSRRPARRVEVLHNWLEDAPNRGCSIQVDQTALAGRRIFVYAGNMGVAQGMSLLIDAAERMRERTDVGFLFVGRGNDAARLREAVAARGLGNVLFFDEIDPDEIPGLYAQCNVGLVALDPRHKTHNIPGKFLSYMHCGLPVLAAVNHGNDLVRLIEDEKVGRACTDATVDTLEAGLLGVLRDIEADHEMPTRCRALAARMFSPAAAVRQIVAGLEG